MFKNLICPVSNEKIDSNVNRITIFISILFVVSFVLTGNAIFLYISAIDYCIRAFTSGKFSPLRYIAANICSLISGNPKLIDKDPKIFASRLGFLCLLASSILINVNFPVASIVIAITASSLFLLDALGIVCVGCLIYHHIVFPLYEN